MSSPCKRIKLTPKKDRVSVRLTQESKVTSTPQRGSRKLVSPNISRISSTNGSSSVRTRLSDVFEREAISDREDSTSTSTQEEVEEQSQSNSRSSTLFTIASERSEFAAIEDYDKYINECTIKYTGKLWNYYQPVHDNTLYAQILQDPRNVQDVVAELLFLYNRKPENAVCHLIKLCVDVSGFQNFEVAAHYNLIVNDPKRIIEIMESSRVLGQQENLINTGRYLLMETKGLLLKILKASIYNFIQKFIVYAHDRGILYDVFFIKHFCAFIKCMSFSRIRAIRHTGVIFAIKILTALVMVYEKITNKENSCDSSIDNMQTQKQQMNNYIEFIYLIFIKNCLLQEKRVVLMKMDCIYELSTWIRYFPKIFITQLQSVNYLIKLIRDPLKDVRLAALETSKTLVEIPEVLAIIKNTSPDFMEHIGARFYDVDIKVAIKAIDIYRNLLKYNDGFLITKDRFKMLTNLIFDKHFSIGEAASKFVISFLERTENTQEILLIRLTEISMKPGYAVKQLMVEGCLDVCPAIHNWKLYINIFLQNDVELNTKKHLAELFSEAVHQKLTGRSSIMREKSRKVTLIDPDEHMKIAKYFPVFPELIKKYRKYPNILIEFLKIFMLVKDTALNEVSVECIENISSMMERLFDDHDNEILLQKLCATLLHFSNTDHTGHVKNIIENILLNHANDLVENFSDQIKETASIALKVSILFANFNLTMKLKWETLFDSWGNVDESTTEHLLSCCRWYLIWQLRNLTNTENPTTQFPILTRICKEFISTCFNMLQNLEGQQLHFKTYECLCNVHLTYMKDLEELVKSDKEMQQLKSVVVLDDKQLQNVLINFLETYIINNTRKPLYERRSFVVKYVDLVHLNILPVECLANIFKYYHMYNTEYGPIIESSLSDIAKEDENTFVMMIVYTLTVNYENIIRKYGAVDMATQEAVNLRLLIKQFLNFKEFKPVNKRAEKCVYFAINYSLKDESRYPFLYFIKYFVDLAHKDERKELLSFLKEKVPKSAEKNDAVLFLADYLKNEKPNISQKADKSSFLTKNKENKKQNKKTVMSRKSRPQGSGKKAVTIQKKTVPVKGQKQKNTETETDASEDDLTIHDSESDDLDESFTNLRV